MKSNRYLPMGREIVSEGRCGPGGMSLELRQESTREGDRVRHEFPLPLLMVTSGRRGRTLDSRETFNRGINCNVKKGGYWESSYCGYR